MTDSTYPKPVETSIKNKLKETFLPTHVDVLNESYMHNVPKGAETHFKVVVVSDKFVDVPLIKVTYYSLGDLSLLKTHCHCVVVKHWFILLRSDTEW